MNSRKIISAALGAAFALSLFALPASAEGTFTDVASDAWYAEAVEWAVSKGITSGTGDGTTFSPDGVLSYAQAVQFIYNSKGLKSDEESNPWYKAAQDWGIENSYINQDTEIKADCTRLEFVEMLYSAAGSPEVKSETPFNDTDSAAAIWASENNIASGNKQGQFLPDEPLKRATTAQFLYNAAKAAGTADIYNTGDASTPSDVEVKETTKTVVKQRTYTTQYSTSSAITGATTTYTYDDYGNVLTETTVNQGSTKTASTVTYTYNDSHRVVMKETAYPGSASYKVTYTYDEAGRLTKEVDSSADSTSDTVIAYKYDAAGILIEKDITSAEGTESTAYGYDSNGNLVLETYTGDDTTYTNTYKYVNDLCVTKSHKFTVTGTVTKNGKTETAVTDSGIEVTDYNYDADGNMISEIEKDKLGRITFATSYAYDSNQQVSTVTIWAYSYNTTTGKLADSVKTENSYYYDAAGNVLYHEQRTDGNICETETYEYMDITVKE